MTRRTDALALLTLLTACTPHAEPAPACPTTFHRSGVPLYPGSELRPGGATTRGFDDASSEVGFVDAPFDRVREFYARCLAIAIPGDKSVTFSPRDSPHQVSLTDRDTFTELRITVSYPNGRGR